MRLFLRSFHLVFKLMQVTASSLLPHNLMQQIDILQLSPLANLVFAYTKPRRSSTRTILLR